MLGGRRKAPLILPAVVTTHGEFCPGAVQLQEWLVERYRARLRLEGERDDGEKEDDLITAFRCELRAALLVATAKGTAEMLAVAGRPFLKGGAKGNRADPVARPPVARVASASLPPPAPLHPMASCNLLLVRVSPPPGRPSTSPSPVRPRSLPSGSRSMTQANSSIHPPFLGLILILTPKLALLCPLSHLLSVVVFQL